ncbi:hypothetical protein D3C81_914660 [compost metagenome]
MEWLQRIGLLAHTEELDGLAGDVTDRQRGTATRVAVDLGQHYAGQRQRLVKGLGRIGGILTGHGIDHKQGFHRLDRRMHLFDLVHHRFVYVQTAGGIDDQHVVEFQLGLLQCTVNDVDRLFFDIRREEIDADAFRQRFQLPDRRRTVNVRGNHQHFFLLFFFQEFAELGDAGGFTGTLQARHQHHSRWLRRQIQLGIHFAHRGNQLALDDLDEFLPRRQALVDFMPHRTLFDAVDKVAHYRQRNVRFQQRHAYFTQGFLDILFGQPPTAADIAQCARQSIG